MRKTRVKNFGMLYETKEVVMKHQLYLRLFYTVWGKNMETVLCLWFCTS